MIKRTIISLESGQDGILIKLLKSPELVPNGEQLLPFNCDPDLMPAWTEALAVQAHGQHIHAALCAAHPAVKQALINLRNTPNGDIHSLFFHLVSDEAERLHWEALCDDLGTFLALDGRWPIARMAGSSIDRVLPLQREFTPPLKFVAFLSALGISARAEWQRLKAVLTQARQDGLAVELSLFIGEEDLLTEIQAEITNGNLLSTTVNFVTTSVELEQTITRLQPHILHFFCHGTNSHGVARLELATMQDWLTESTASSLQVNIDALLNLHALEYTWLVTLNCCEGAKPADNAPANEAQNIRLNSMVRQLVARGVPAAVGMVEAMDASDANEFCAGFYSALLGNVQSMLKATSAGNEVEIDWELALRQARLNVNNRYGGAAPIHREWTLPALYVQVDRFRLVVPAKQPPEDILQRMMQKAKDIARALQALPLDTPAGVRTQLLALLDDLPAALRPNIYGSFV